MQASSRHLPVPDRRCVLHARRIGSRHRPALVCLQRDRHAQGRTDVVTLANGDRITGEIVRLERGRLEFKTDDAGTLYLEWDKLVSLVATRAWSKCVTTRRPPLPGHAWRRRPTDRFPSCTPDGDGAAPDDRR